MIIAKRAETVKNKEKSRQQAHMAGYRNARMAGQWRRINFGKLEEAAC
jgi:hypothetical protein